MKKIDFLYKLLPVRTNYASFDALGEQKFLN